MQIEEFENARPHLLAVATRMLGSAGEAQDAVQETWLRADRADTSDVANPRGWLTTVLSRICLDTLRARRDVTHLDDESARDLPAAGPGPGEEAELADAVGAALGAVVGELEPAERVAFVLHDVFAVPFDEVSRVLGRTPAATRQVASRARRRVAGAAPARPAQADAVRAFLAASRDGDFAGLVDVLDPDAVFRTYGDDAGPVTTSGASAIAEAFMFRAKTALAALVDGRLGYVVPVPGADGARYLLFADVAFGPDGRITAIDAILRADEVAGREIDLLAE